MIHKSAFISKILLKQTGYSPKIAITGESQVGKSTFCWWLSNELSHNQLTNFSRDWDYKKYCATSIKQFAELVAESENEVIVLEEASFQAGKMSFWDTFTRALDEINQTQGVKRNFFIFVMPCLPDLAKSLRAMNYLFCVSKKIERRKLAVIMPQEIKIDYWRIDDKATHQDFSPKIMRKVYTDEELKKAGEYSEWLRTYKSKIMEKILSKLKT